MKSARTTKGLTQAELARLSGVGQGDVSKLENGTVAGTTKVAQLAHVLGVDPFWLATGEGQPWGQAGSAELEIDQRGGNVVGIPVRGASLFLEGQVDIDAKHSASEGVILGSGVNDGYAVLVVGDRNAPALKDGQFVVIEDRPVPEGDLGLFHMTNGATLLRELLRETETAYHVDSAAWGARQTFSKSDVRHTEHIVAVVSPSRWKSLKAD